MANERTERGKLSQGRANRVAVPSSKDDDGSPNREIAIPISHTRKNQAANRSLPVATAALECSLFHDK